MKILSLPFLACLALTAQTPPAKPKPAAVKPKPAAVKPKPAVTPASPAEPAVLTIGAEKYTQKDFEAFLEALPPAVRTQTATPQGKRQIAEQLAEVKALAQEARRRKLHEQAPTRQQLQLQQDQILANAALNQMMTTAPVPEEALRKYYDENKANQFQQVQARHILVRFKGSQVPLRPNQPDLTEAEAEAKVKQLRERIEQGEDFAVLAKAESDDSGSGASGGNLGTFGRGQMVPEFENAAFALNKGELSQPVRSQFGYHLIQLQDRVSREFDDVRAEIEQKLRPEHARRLARQLREKSGLVMEETYFGKAQ
jgi:peptidyl-prolyl cis-trans isomerase C